jgi:hypothetical protein
MRTAKRPAQADFHSPAAYLYALEAYCTFLENNAKALQDYALRFWSEEDSVYDEDYQTEQQAFEAWATPMFPGLLIDEVIQKQALDQWAIEKRTRALEAQGITRSDAQGIIEAEDLSK